MIERPIVEIVVPQPTGSGVRRKVTVMLDGIDSVQFFLRGMNVIWFDRFILLPIFRMVLLYWLKWTAAGGKIEFVYSPEECLKGDSAR